MHNYDRGPMTQSNAKSRALFWLRIAVSVGLLAVLIHNRPDLKGAIPTQHQARTITFLVLGVITAGAGVVLSAWRWQRVLRVYGEHASLQRLTMHTLVGLTVSNVLPSTIGGDVLRVARLSKDISNPEVAFASVALERLTGFIALPLVGIAGFLLRPSLLSSDQAWLVILVSGITLGLLGAILVLAAHPRAAGRFAERDNWVRFIGAIHVGVDRLRRDPKQAGAVLIAAVSYQAAVVASVALIATAIQLPAPVAAIIAFVPAVAMVQVIPISMNGLGVREGMLIRFLTPLSVTKGQSLALGLLWGASLLLISFAGVPAFLASRQRTNVHRNNAVEADAQ
jgi:glycosyltransferase 2 family protein